MEKQNCQLCVEGGMGGEPGMATHRVSIDEHSNHVFFCTAGLRSIVVCNDCLNAGPWEHEGIDDETGEQRMYADEVEAL